MRAVDIIAKKRDGHSLTRDEINFIIRGYTSGEVADYQMSALLMAIYLRGMTTEETLAARSSTSPTWAARASISTRQAASAIRPRL